MDKTNQSATSKSYSIGAEQKQSTSTHKLEIDHHRMFSLTGVKDVPIFTDKNITVILDGETLTITGQNFSVKNLDIENGKLNALGDVRALKYSASGSGSLVKRIFK